MIGRNARSAKKYSRAELAYHCQPRAKSRSSSLFVAGCGGSVPATASCQVGKSSAPSSPSRVRALATSCKQLVVGPWSLPSSVTIIPVTRGAFDARTGRASTHEAQWADSAVRRADRRPKPPRLAGSEATLLASRSVWCSSAPSMRQNVYHNASSCSFAYACDCDGGSTRMVWFALGTTEYNRRAHAA